VTSEYVPSFAVEETEPKKLWDQCVVKISPKCALDIIVQDFGNGVVSIPCCQELVKEGKSVTIPLSNIFADRPTLIANETKYLQKRDELWAQCVSVSKSI
ncbi:hypothetical protein EUTSA_v10019422mg, partial [Eutrema salsugineum]